ncbi:MAG: ATP-binding cassette domain-containing protein [Saprospiraceae bacterium]|nr:ATP-binding cassette domain-containing protein [Saprospiraceae bacterium]
MATDTTHTTLTPLRRLFRLLSQYRSEIRYILLYAVVTGMINLSLPLGIQAIINQIAGGAMNASWVVMVLFVLIGALAVGIIRIMQLSVVEYMQRRIFAYSSIDFALRIPRLNLEVLRGDYIPELVNRFFDTLTIQKGLPKILIDGSTALLQIGFSLLLLSFYHPSFVLFSLLLIGVLAILFYWTAPLGVQTSLKESKFKYKIAYWLEEVGRVANTFKLAGENNFPLRRTDDLTVHYLDARAKHWRIMLIQMISSVVFRVLVLAGFLILGSALVMSNELNIGQFVASEILILFVIESMEKLILLHETGYDVLTAVEKMGQVADLPLEREDGVAVEEFCPVDQPMEVEMRNLSYQYSDAQEPVLQNISLRIKPGERVLIAGYTGSGKSTLLQILTVLKRDFTGHLLFNGLPKKNLNLRSLREHIGDLSSQEDIFKGSILENITLGNPDIPLKRVLELIDVIGLSDFIREAQQGIETEILPGGQNISRSTVSKILVARAVAGQPNFLAMEQPLGHLNFRDRLRIAQFLTDPKHSWTFVASSADPILAALCDRVVILKKGQIVFEGTFEEVENTEHYLRVFRTSPSTQNDQD